MPLVFDLFRRHSAGIICVAKDIVVIVFLVVDLKDYLVEALGSNSGRAHTVFQWANGHTLAQEQLLVERSYTSGSVQRQAIVKNRTYQTSGAARPTPRHTRILIAGCSPRPGGGVWRLTPSAPSGPPGPWHGSPSRRSAPCATAPPHAAAPILGL